jgi:hypothetical protein
MVVIPAGKLVGEGDDLGELVASVLAVAHGDVLVVVAAAAAAFGTVEMLVDGMVVKPMMHSLERSRHERCLGADDYPTDEARKGFAVDLGHDKQADAKPVGWMVGDSYLVLAGRQPSLMIAKSHRSRTDLLAW